MNINKVNPNLVIIAVLAIGGYFAYNKFFGPSKKEKQGDKFLEEQEKKTNIWAGVASLQKTIKPTQTIKLLTFSDSNIIAKKINDAWGYFNDDEEAVYAAFRALRFQTQVASLVDAYRKLYNKDLLNTLKSNLNDAELYEVINIIGTKPIGIEKK
jgi:hypothetical protein